jgi:hypothetical protein
MFEIAGLGVAHKLAPKHVCKGQPKLFV